MASKDIIIIGSGVCGLSAATELVSRGVSDLRIIDAVSAAGPHHCSWWAGGMLAPYCEKESAEDLVVELGLEAAQWWEDQGVKVTRNGSLVVALGRDQSELKRFARRTSNFEEINQAQIEALEPDIAGQFSKALYFKDEAHLSPRDALAALREKLVTHNVVFETRDIESVSDFAKDNADKTILDCRGLSARDHLPDLRGVKGEMLVLSCPEISLSRPIRLLHPRIPLYIVPRGDGIFMLGATQIESGERTRITARSMLELLSAAYAINPVFGEAEILEIGVDARPAFPDNLPRISQSENVISLNGLFRHGYLLAPSLARMAADYIFNNEQPRVWHENSA